MEGSSKQKLVAVCGPTASGKTSLGIQLANAFQGEIISADSMQIYKGLDVGTAKPTPEEQARAVHHMIDFLPPQQGYSVAEYVTQAGRCIEEIAARGHQPFLVGGTGLYLSSLLRGMQFERDNQDTGLREQLYLRLEQEGSQALYHQLEELDPQAAQKIHPNNHVRVIRTLEMCLSGGTTATSQKAKAVALPSPYNALVLCLDFPDRQMLYQRIEKRVDLMMEAGILQEAQEVYRNRQEYKTAAQAIGYKEFFPYFEGKSSLEDCVARLKQASRNYAKRQLTWLRRMPDTIWLDASLPDCTQKAKQLVEDFLEL